MTPRERRERHDRQEWINGLWRRWGLVTCEGLAPTGDLLTDLLVEQASYGLVSIVDARAMIGTGIPFRDRPAA